MGRALIAAVEAWCIEHGYAELASDVELASDDSLHAHAALGFETIARIQFFRELLPLGP